MHIACVNHSTLVSNADVQTMTRAVAKQLRYHYAPAWGVTAPSIVYYASDADVPPSTHIIGVFDDSDQQGALGWHTEDAGEAIYGRVFTRPVLTNGGTVLNGQLTVSSVLSHEAIEMSGDASCCLWADSGNGELHAVELCDPVESDSYHVTVSVGGVSVLVAVSNFVYPAWFDPQAKSGDRFDQLGVVSGPFVLARGGYEVYRSGGAEQQRFGDEYAAWRRATKSSPLARSVKRGMVA